MLAELILKVFITYKPINRPLIDAVWCLLFVDFILIVRPILFGSLKDMYCVLS